MNELVSCHSCGAGGVPAGSFCPACGKPTGGGGGAGFLPLIGWVLIPLAILVYPILGIASSLAMLAVNGLAHLVGLSEGFRLLAVAVTGYASLFLTISLERSASRIGVYRLLRTLVRVLVCVGIAIGAIQGADSDSAGGVLFFVVVVIPVIFWAARRLDRILGVGGPAKPDPAKNVPAADPSTLFWNRNPPKADANNKTSGD